MQKDSLGPFRIFANPRYSLYFGGQLISFIGTWMQQVALAWFTYEITGSPFLLALVGVSSQLPSLIVMPVAGVLADRLNRHKIIITTQVLAMIQASVLAYLTITGQVAVYHLVILGVVAGLINSFDMPSRSAFVISLVDREDLPGAVAMNSSLLNVTRLIGPALAGFLVAAYGAGICFLLNALSYIAVIVALLCIKGDFRAKKKERKSVLGELKEGVVYAARTRTIGTMLLMVGIFGLGAAAYMLLLPVFVKQIGGDANTLGYLMSASALGSLCGTLTLAGRRSTVGLGRWVVASSFFFGFALLAFAYVKSFVIALIALAFIGGMMMLMMASCSTILQTAVEEEKRGRVMSLFAMSFMGTAPLGGMLGGWVADHFGFHATVLGCGFYCLAVAAIFGSRIWKLDQELEAAESTPPMKTVTASALNQEPQEIGQKCESNRESSLSAKSVDAQYQEQAAKTQAT